MDLKALLFGIVTICMIALVASAMQDAQDDYRDDIINNIVSGTTINETVAYSNATITALTKNWEVTCTAVYNGTSGDAAILIQSSNYTCGSAGLNLTDCCGHTWNSTVAVTYNFKNKSNTYNISTNSLQGGSNATDYLGNIGTFLGIAVLVGMIGLLLIKRIGNN